LVHVTWVTLTLSLEVPAKLMLAVAVEYVAFDVGVVIDIAGAVVSGTV